MLDLRIVKINRKNLENEPTIENRENNESKHSRRISTDSIKPETKQNQTITETVPRSNFLKSIQ